MMKDFCMCVFVPKSVILMRQLQFQNEKLSIQESIGIGKRSIKNGLIIGIYEENNQGFQSVYSCFIRHQREGKKDLRPESKESKLILQIILIS